MWHRVLSRLLALFQRRRLDDEIREELQFHLEMMAEANERGGMSPPVARNAALRDFGGVGRHAEAIRDQRWLFIDGVSQDLRYALRSFKRAPAFSVTAVLTLAIGIGATTATYSVVDSLLFRPVPLPGSERIVSVLGRNPSSGAVYMGVRQDVFTNLQNTDAFEAIASWDYLGNVLQLTEGGGREAVVAAEVSSGFFAVAGVQPAIGRAFHDGECRNGANGVVVLSNEYWKRRFGGDAKIVRRKLQFEGGERTVVGIMPPRFWYPRLLPGKDPEVYYPAVFSWDKPLRNKESVHFLLARLRPDVPLASAQATADVVASRLSATSPENKDLRLAIVPFRRQMGERARSVLLLLQAAVLFLLLIAAANVGNMALGQGRARQVELAIRSTLGASRARVARQVATETVTLSLVGGLAGMAVAWFAVSGAKDFLPRRLAFAPEVSLDLRVFALGVGLSLIVGLACGIVPTLIVQRRCPCNARLAGAPFRGRTAWAPTLQSGLVGLEAALVVVLLVGTGLVLNSLVRVNSTRLGFGYSLDRFATIGVEPPRVKGGSRSDWAALVDRASVVVSRIPEVEAVVDIAPTPLAREASGLMLLETPGGQQRIEVRFVGSGALEALGLMPIEGRLFLASEMKGEPEVVVVTHEFARRFLGGNPVGQVIAGQLNRQPTRRTVVGVVADVKDQMVLGGVSPLIFTPFDVRARNSRHAFLVRTSKTASDSIPALGTALQSAGIRAEIR